MTGRPLFKRRALFTRSATLPPSSPPRVSPNAPFLWPPTNLREFTSVDVRCSLTRSLGWRRLLHFLDRTVVVIDTAVQENSNLLFEKMCMVRAE